MGINFVSELCEQTHLWFEPTLMMFFFPAPPSCTILLEKLTISLLGCFNLKRALKLFEPFNHREDHHCRVAIEPRVQPALSWVASYSVNQAYKRCCWEFFPFSVLLSCGKASEPGLSTNHFSLWCCDEKHLTIKDWARKTMSFFGGRSNAIGQCLESARGIWKTWPRFFPFVPLFLKMSAAIWAYVLDWIHQKLGSCVLSQEPSRPRFYSLGLLWLV